jgi:hypothetical protein
MVVIAVNLVTPKAAAKHELLFISLVCKNIFAILG